MAFQEFFVENTQKTDVDISIVVPLYNEVESMPELVSQIDSAIKESSLHDIFKRSPTYEILCINDGSTDGSDKVIKDLYQNGHSEVKLVSFQKNYGKSAGLNIGFKLCKGAYVITMDADLQDNPDEIEPLIRKLNNGYDLVSGWKKKRYDPLTKTLPSKLFNYVTGLLSGVHIHDFNCGLKAYRHEVVKTLEIYGEMHRYIPVIAKMNGFRISEIEVRHRARKYGTTKFGISRFFNGFFDLLTIIFITKYLQRPMHFFGMIGSVSALLGFAINLYITYEKIFFNIPVSNRPILFLGVLLIILGVLFFSTGLLGEMITKTYTKNDPLIIKELLNVKK